MEQKLMSFENKILRIVCGPVYDNELDAGAEEGTKRSESWQEFQG
jgi:hypothetical protein